jgi:autotransporter-associated beta strand protein
MKPTYLKNRFLLLQTSAALALLINSATAATYTWTGVTSTTWSVATNWTGGIPAVANTSDVIIGGITNVGNMLAGSQSYTVKSLTFDGTNDANTALTLQTTGNNNSGSRALTFSSDLGNATMTVAADSTGDKTLNRGGTAVSDIVLTSSLDIVHNGSGNLTIGPLARFTSAGGINKSGTGTLLLSGANTYTGATTITTGTLSLGSGGTTGSLTATSAITNNSNLTINRSDAFSQATDLGAGVAITGTGSFTKAGTGTTTLTAANTYTGNTLVSAGTLKFAKTASFYSDVIDATTGAKLTVNSGGTAAFNIGGTGEFTEANINTLLGASTGTVGFKTGSVLGLDTTNASGGNFTLAGTLANPTGSTSLGLTKLGTGTLTLNGTNATYTGLTTVNSGTLLLGHPTDTLSSSSAITVDGATAVLAIAGNSDTVGVVSLKNGGSITGTGGTLTGASYSVESGSVSATLGGAGIALTKSTAGTVTLSGTSTYTGITTLSAGILNVGVAESVGVSGPLGNSASANPGSIVFGGGTLQYSVSNTHDYSGRFSTDAGQAYSVNTNGQNVTWAANLTGSGVTLTKTTGGGNLTLSGNNTFTGGVTVSASGGKVIAGHNNALGSGTVALAGQAATLELANGIAVANAMSVAASGNFKILRLADGAISATYAGNIVNSEDVGSNFDLSASTGGTLTISGIISSGHANAGFETVGAGTVTLTGANTYTGGTTVTTGTLTLAATGSIATSSSVAVGAAGSLDTSAQAAYTIPGTQPLAFGINATGSGSSGKIVAAGLNISSAVVTYNITGTPDDPVYVLATYTSLTGTFATVPAPPTGYTLDYAYQGNKIALVLPASNNYASWADDNGIPGEPASGDFENDGISNVVEYALGTSPTVSTQPAGVLSGNVITFTKGADAIANGDVSWVIETSQTLAAGSWTAVVTQPAADPAPTISYTLTPSTPEKNFARLKVIQIP